MYVQLLAKERRRILNHVLEATVDSFPSTSSIEKHSYVREVALIMRTFFLTDHCSAEDTRGKAYPEGKESSGNIVQKSAERVTGGLKKVAGDLKKLEDLNPISWLSGKLPGHDSNQTPKAGNTVATSNVTGSVVVPLSTRERRCDSQRSTDEKELGATQEARLILDGDRPPTEFLPSYAHPMPTVRPSASNHLGTLIDTNPLVFLAIAAAAVAVLSRAGILQVRLDGDIALLIVFGAFCLGLHTPRPMVGGFDRPPTMMGAVVKQQDRSGRRLLRTSMVQQTTMRQLVVDRDDHLEEILAPTGPVPSMDKFPLGAAIGSHNK
jgi:hypothetical protein